MTFHCAPNPIYVGAAASCTAHVGGGATGSVDFQALGQELANIPLDSNGNATGSTSAFMPGPGTYTISGTYSGDANYAPLTRSEGLTVYSGKVMVTQQTLVCAPYAVLAGNPLSCKVQIPGGATGTISFSINGAGWGSVPLDASGNASITNGLTTDPGTYVVEATYSGDSNFDLFTTSTAVPVLPFKPIPSSMQVGCTPAAIVTGGNSSCVVQLTGGANGQVDLYVHDQHFASANVDQNGTVSFSNVAAGLPAGSTSVTAVYAGDSNFDIASAATVLQINAGPNNTTIGLSCSPSSITPGQNTTCTAQLPSGATGDVIFCVGGNYWISVHLDGNAAASTPPGLYNLSANTYSLVAYYAGDANFSEASSGISLQVAAAKAVPSIDLSCAPTPIVSGSGTNCTATVAGGATGVVQIGSSDTVTDALGLNSNGSVVFGNQLNGASPGQYTLQASYQGDVNFAPANNIITVAVNASKADPQMTAELQPTVIRSGDQLFVHARLQAGATGTVTLTRNGVFTGTLPVDANGDVLGAVGGGVTGGSDGDYDIGFAYSGDQNFNPKQVDRTLTISANAPPPPGPPTTQPANPVVYAYSITQPDGTTSGYDPAGNIIAYSDAVNGQWTAQYDALNRITGAKQIPLSGKPQLPWSGSLQQTFCWIYDSFGNRVTQAASDVSFSTDGTCQVPSSANLNLSQATINANNQVTSMSGQATTNTYDEAGNLGDNGNESFLYDGEGRLCAYLKHVTGIAVGYIYDAEGQRIAKGSLTSFSCDLSSNGFSMTNEYTHSPTGELLTEFDGQQNVLHTDVYTGGQLIATYTGDNALHFQFADWLGTRRVQTDYAGSVESSFSNAVFGDELPPASQDATEKHFTGKERDAESGLDNFGARYFGSTMGRFISPDPSGLVYADPRNPQSLNLYSYVMNDPLTNIDPTGKTCQTNSSDGNTYDDGDGQGCATVDQQNADRLKNGQYSATVTAPPPSAVSQVAYAVGSFIGFGPKNITYSPGDSFTRNFQQSLGMAHINSFIKSRCGTSHGRGFVGTGEAFVNTAIDAGTDQGSISEAQLGAFEYQYSSSGGTTNITVNNDISLNSLAGHIFNSNPNLTPEDMAAGDTMAGAGRVEGNVPFGAVHQTMNITEADPCR